MYNNCVDLIISGAKVRKISHICKYLQYFFANNPQIRQFFHKLCENLHQTQQFFALFDTIFPATFPINPVNFFLKNHTKKADATDIRPFDL